MIQNQKYLPYDVRLDFAYQRRDNVPYLTYNKTFLKTTDVIFHQ